MPQIPESNKRWIIVCVDLAGINLSGREAPKGAFLKSFDANAFQGRGSAMWTKRKADAMMFETPAEAFDCWRQPSTIRPMREDGLTNRPLTAFTVEVIEIELPGGNINGDR